MEERPCKGATTGVYNSHGAENGSDRPNISVNNDQNQNEKTQTKKTENGKINGTLKEGEVTPTSFNPDSSPHPADSNGDRHVLEINLKPKPTRWAFTTETTGDRKGRNTSRNSMDLRNDKSSELNTIEGKKKVLASLNGVVSHSSVPLTNGYPSKPGADNDGSGSESAYTTPKKRRAQRNGKTGDNVTAFTQGKVMQQGSKQESPESALECGKAGPKTEGCHVKAKEPPASGTPPPVAELQRKNSDGKATGKKFEERSSKVKVAASTKEDSWTLFKPPPVFPVDNSSAKIVPKISYASKVKENLNKTAQTGVEALAPAPQVPGRPPQVPMSAVKTITSASFTNGPLSGEGNGCPLPGPHFSSMASTGPLLVSPAVPAENVASPPGGVGAVIGSSTTSLTEPRKASLFVYPNMQLSLPSGRQADPPAALTNQKALVDIFQNQWGLSFINEPSVGPEGVACRSNGKDVPVPVEVSFQGGCPATVATQTSSNSQRQDHPPFPKTHEPEKRTNAQNLSKGVPAAGGSISETSVINLDIQKDETGVHGAIVFCSSSKDVCAELPPTSPAAPKVALAKDQGHAKGFDKRSSWGSFDLKAAVIYHTKEMEYILNLQKQDPNRVVLYSESWDGPAQ